MSQISQFPEIQNYIPLLSEEEQRIYNQEKILHNGNTLSTQLAIIESIIEKTTKQTDILLFLLGKLLFNLSEWDKVIEKMEEYKDSLFFQYWVGMTFFRTGKFEFAKNIFEQLAKAESNFLQIEGKIGLTRISDRKGEKSVSKHFFEQIKKDLQIELKSEKKTIIFDTFLRAGFAELWCFRSEINVNESKKICKEYLEKSIAYEDRIHIASFYIMLGIFDKYQGNWQSAKDYLNLAKKVYRKLGNIRGEITVISNIADVERMEGNLESAQGRLLSVLSFYQLWKDKRSEAIVFQNLGEINAQKRYFLEAIEDFSKAKAILESINARDELLDYVIAESYIEIKNWSEFSKIMGEILKDKEEEEILQNPQILYLYAKKEMQELNLSKAKKFLEEALKVAGKKRMDHLGVKILVDTLKVAMSCFISQLENDNINEITKLVEDLKLFFEETQQGQVFTTALLKMEEDIRKIGKETDNLETRKLILEVQKDIKELSEAIKYSLEGKKIESTLPNQLIILHRSGIPIKRYVKENKIVDDVLLFGGMVRAAKDIITEVFTGEVGKVMKIDYGENIKILTEFGDKEAGVVMITQKDTFHQRRSLHESVIELNKIDFPSQYYGEISDSTEEQIDEIINKWFGIGYSGEK